VFVLADDAGCADLGCTGARDAGNQPTDVSPRLDRMAHEGMRFTRAYAPGGLDASVHAARR